MKETVKDFVPVDCESLTHKILVLLQLAVGIYIALMGVFVTFYFAAEMFQLFRD